ncbi:hypothetical protein LPJ81_003827 [Coemansia sp. IMI 209127]|nr:hypothetical protein LPJ81_003827 [Coemansia sp. IMI 209127]
MDRKVALPSFREVAGTLPSPSFSNNADPTPKVPTAPRPIPFDRAVSKSPSGPHSSAGTRYSIHSESSSATANYIHIGSDTTASSYLHQQPQQQQQQRHFVPQPSSSFPRQAAARNTFLSSSPPPPIGSREQQQTSAYSMHSDGALSPYESSAAQQPQSHARNVYGVAQVTTDPIMQQRKSSSLTHPQQQPSFMHSPPSSASSRFAPYHMPASYSLPVAAPVSGGMVRKSSSPKFRYEGPGINNGDFSVSRAAAAISSVALSSPSSPTVHVPPAMAAQRRQMAPFQQNEQRQMTMHPTLPRYVGPRHSTPGGPISAPLVSGAPGMSVAPINIPPPLTIAHSPSSLPGTLSMSLTQQRMDQHSLSEHMEQDDAEDDILDCYDDSTQPHGADGGPIMTTAKIRTIHKLAERRRRREMKNLFDTLRKCLPIDKSIRLSKWEVLKKAIEVISSQDAEIHMLRLHIDANKNNTAK